MRSGKAVWNEGGRSKVNAFSDLLQVLLGRNMLLIVWVELFDRMLIVLGRVEARRRRLIVDRARRRSVNAQRHLLFDFDVFLLTHHVRLSVSF
jgi:hypothetical protein